MAINETIIEQKSYHLLLKAMNFGASDLHLFPEENGYRVYFKKFGQLIHAGQFPYELGERIISYFKYLSSLDIGERRKPQSGSFQRELNEHPYAFRVSTLPSIYLKESLVIRLMLQDHAISISALSVFPSSTKELVELVSMKQGILFFSGPTGCGKTTSLYSLVNYCSQQLNRHVISLEDPVENNQSQLLQIQVNERAGVTYASGLKAILRHSPDVIMIGEIRDKDTAKIAIQAALTGHLVLTSVHAMDSIGCLFRLMDLGVSLEDLKQTVIGIVAQTLVKVQRKDQEENRAAIFEILNKMKLKEAFDCIERGKDYQMPISLTLRGQLEEGVARGVIVENSLSLLTK